MGDVMAILPIRPLEHKVGDLALCSQTVMGGKREFIGRIRDTMQSDVYGNVYYIDPFEEFKEDLGSLSGGGCNERDTYQITEQQTNELRVTKKSINDDITLRKKVCEELCENATKDIKERYVKNEEKLENSIENIRRQKK